MSNQITYELKSKLKQRFENYFKETEKTKYADNTMVIKILVAYIWWIGSYLLLLLLDSSFIQFIGLYLFHGLSHILLTLGVGHDANHNAISSSKKLNRILSYSMDICGVSSLFWRISHNQSHHNNLNVEGKDVPLTTGKLLRFSPNKKRLTFHKYQHIYAWLLYSLYTIDYVLVRDIRWYFTRKSLPGGDIKMKPSKIAIMFLGKMFYLSYMLVLPTILLDFSFWQILLAFVIMHMVLGLAFLIIFQTGHLLHDAAYPTSASNFPDFEEHVLSCTADFAVDNKFIGWYFGGMNTHSIHHLYPTICHTHYSKLTKILRTTVMEYGYNYRCNRTLRQAIVSHYNHLKEMGREGTNF